METSMKKLFLTMLVLLTALTPHSQLNAINPEQKRILDSGARYFDLEANNCTPNVARGGVDRFLQVLAFNESRGNPTAANPDSSARGKYQYITGTWRSVAQTYYPPAMQYATADQAPEEVQDAVAYLEYTKKFNDLDSDVFKLAVSHFYPIANTQPELLDRNPPSNNITPREYADSLIEKMNSSGDWDNITLNYNAAPDFSTHFSAVSNGGTSGVTQSGANSCGTTTSSAQNLDGFVIYSQYDSAWASKPYGSSTIAVSGCGPSALAMIIASFGDTSVTPETVATWAGDQGYYISGQGSSWALMDNGPSHWGLTSTNIGTDMNSAIEALRSGSYVIASGRGPKPFTTGGHILALRGVTADGKILIGDSGHRDTSTVEYEPSQLSGSIRNMWVVSR